MTSPYGPVAAPVAKTNHDPRCHACQRRLAEYLTAPYSIRCQRCGEQNVAE